MSDQDNKPPYLKKTANSNLRLVHSSPPPAEEENLLLEGNPDAGFTTSIRKKGENVYTLIARDPAHCLGCRFDLEIHEDAEDLEPMSVTCRFPDLPAEEMFEMLGEDETLHGIILLQFQMKVLERLLLFCSEQNASWLFVYGTHTHEEGHALGFFSNLALYEDLVPADTGKIVQIIIPTTTRTYDKLVDFMDRLNREFRQTLWQEQGTSPAIRAYLKSNPGLNFFD
jgi:hypothetical protein